MKTERRFTRWTSGFLAALLLLPGPVLAQSAGEPAAPASPQAPAQPPVPMTAQPPVPVTARAPAQGKAFSQEQLDQLLAPVALYPDDLLTQLLMASTYPLEVVKANNWAKANKDLKGGEMTKALEKQNWDPSIKSLVNFPQVLQMMSDKIEWTQNLGDAFLAQQKDVLDTVQKLRKKAYDQGNLKTTKEQKVSVDNTTQVIIVQPASPEVVYVPSYNPTVVYGTWWYPAYPPYYVYPPGYAAGAFFTGVAVGVAWGYAWGHSDWHGGDVNIDIDRNTNINRDIDRGRYKDQARQGQGQQGKWQHDSKHRQGVSYRDTATANKYGQGSNRQAPASREARGYGNDRGGASAGSMDRGGGTDRYERGGGADRSGSYDRGGGSDRGGNGGGSAFSGSGNSGFDRSASERGQASRGGSGVSGGGSRGGGGRRR
jgi:hypothetical protein